MSHVWDVLDDKTMIFILVCLIAPIASLITRPISELLLDAGHTPKTAFIMTGVLTAIIPVAGLLTAMVKNAMTFDPIGLVACLLGGMWGGFRYWKQTGRQMTARP